MMSPKKTGLKTFRFTDEELERIEAIIEVGRRRQVYANETEIIKELLGITPLCALTQADVDKFRAQGQGTASSTTQMDVNKRMVKNLRKKKSGGD